MTVEIRGFVTRADCGLRPPKSVTRNITPSLGGVAGHYGGPSQPAAATNSDHAKCISTWRNWQNYHMDKHGWADIAYTGGYCNHGYAFAGRGAGVRTAANGTNAGNQNYYAVTWIGGEGQTPSVAAFNAFDWWVNELRTKGGAGLKVKPHKYFKPTGCPGDQIDDYCYRIDGLSLYVPTVVQTNPEVSKMYLLVKSESENPVFAVAPGKWKHVSPEELHVIRKTNAGLNGGVVQVLTEAELDNLRTLVLF